MNEFIEYLTEVFAEFGPIRARRMFGGYGIYHDDLMFALVEDNVLYFKSDDQSASFFAGKGLQQFAYIKKGKTIKLSYYMAPEEIFEDKQEATLWATRAYEAALRGKK